ncbi:MAG: hypothetical protein GXZ00_04370 [Synergistaceae bacterium]|nr:hypothetical protein [Synergistaceae bacterium]
MKKILALMALVISISVLAAFAGFRGSAPVDAYQPMEGGLPLEFTNNSGYEIKHIFISEAGRDCWSEDLLKGHTLKKEEIFNLDINRRKILGLVDFKIVYSSGEEKIWQKLPILEIFEITNREDGDPDYDRIKLGA